MVQTKPIKNDNPLMDERTKAHFEELKNRYFWEQKRKEIGFVLTITLYVILGMLTFAFIILPIIGLATEKIVPDMKCTFYQDAEGITFYDEATKQCNFTGSYVDYIRLGAIGFASILLWVFLAFIALFPLGLCFKSWIDENKELAEKRARKTLGIPEPKKEVSGIDTYY
jgi:hypothetical protein